MGWRHFSTDKAMAIRRYWQDEPDGGVTLVTEQDVENIVDESKRSYNQYDQRSRWRDNLNRVASIPMSIYMKLWQEGRFRDQAALRRWVNDPDNRSFRTRPGKI